MLFCRHHATVPLLLSVLGCWLYSMERVAAPLLIMKAATDRLIWYFITATRQHLLFYYYNLHVSRTMLFLSWLFTDLVIFRILLWLTALIS